MPIGKLSLNDLKRLSGMKKKEPDSDDFSIEAEDELEKIMSKIRSLPDEVSHYAANISDDAAIDHYGKMMVMELEQAAARIRKEFGL